MSFADLLFFVRTDTKYRAEIGGITVAELKAVEVAFLFEMDFSLLISSEEFARTTNDLLLFAALREAGRHQLPTPSTSKSSPRPEDHDSEDSDEGPMRRKPSEEFEPAGRSCCSAPYVAQGASCLSGSAQAGDMATRAVSTAAATLALGSLWSSSVGSLKRDRPRSPPPGPSAPTPERPLAFRRSDSAASPAPAKYDKS